ncbi:hypothetical protein KJA17_01465 [Patescibacteria group bacterium]|nr:hypothetical protein [Patescibacteria group bacterium]
MAKEPLAKIIPKPKPKVAGWLNFLFYFSIILIIILIAGLLFLKSRISSLEEEKERLESQIAELEGEEEKRLEETILSLGEKIKVFKELLKSHKISSNFLSLLESSCHPRVQFTKLNLDTKNYQVSLEGKTESFQSLGEQLLILRKNENIGILNLSNISLDWEGKVNFSLTFSLVPEVFKK